MGGPQPYNPVGKLDEPESTKHNNLSPIESNMKRARVLCSYDAKDGTELSLTGNEVSNREYKIIDNVFQYSKLCLFHFR